MSLSNWILNDREKQFVMLNEVKHLLSPAYRRHALRRRSFAIAQDDKLIKERGLRMYIALQMLNSFQMRVDSFRY
jgi:hypothetical protein